MHLNEVNQMLFKYPPDLKYIVINENGDISYKSFEYSTLDKTTLEITTLEKRVVELEKTVDSLKTELYSF